MKTTLKSSVLLFLIMILGGAEVHADDYALAWNNGCSSTDGWKTTSTATITTNNALVSDDSYLNLMTPNGKDRENTYAFTDANFTSSNHYKFEFDLAIYGSNATNHLAHIILTGNNSANESANLFSVFCTKYSPFTLSAGTALSSVDMSANVTNNNKKTRDITGAATAWCHYTIEGTSEGMYLTVEKYTTSGVAESELVKEDLIVRTKINDNLYHLTQLSLHGGSYNQFSIDNMKLSIVSDKPLTPIASVTKVDGANRTITLTKSSDDYKIYYYTTEDGEANAKEYTAPIVISTSTTLYYYAVLNGEKSEVGSMDVTCEAVTLATPTITRTGAYTYSIAASTTTVDGIIADQLIHYTIGGGSEVTATSGTSVSLNDVKGDIVAWTVADGFTSSEKATMTYVAPIASAEVWSYDLNSYPHTYSITSIADAIDESTATTLNDITVYNLKNINYPNLYVENSSSWLLRNQTKNAFKSQTGTASIVINNVNTKNVIRFNANADNNKSEIRSIDNGEIMYSYSDGTYFIVPSAEGSVKITTNSGVSLNTVGVYSTLQSATITSAKYATYVAQGNVTIPSGVTAYTVKLDGESLTYTALDASTVIPEGTALLLYGEAKTYEFPYTLATASTITDNSLKASTGEGVTADGTQYILANVDGTLGFYQATTGTTIAAGKAYLEVSAETAKAVKCFEIGTTTGISNVSTTTADKGAYYNLQGMKVVRPAKGIFIHNGKKMVIK